VLSSFIGEFGEVGEKKKKRARWVQSSLGSVVELRHILRCGSDSRHLSLHEALLSLREAQVPQAAPVLGG